MRRTLLTILVLVALGACSDDPEPSTSPPADQPATTTTTAAATATTAAPAPSGIQLRADGLGAFAFGAPESEVLPALAEALGHAESDDVLPESACSDGATRSVTWGDLDVLIGPDGSGRATLYGWVYGGGDVPATPVLVTAEGIGVGSTLDQLKAAYGDRVAITPGGDEIPPRFSVEGTGDAPLTGVLNGPAATNSILAIFGGRYCA